MLMNTYESEKKGRVSLMKTVEDLVLTYYSSNDFSMLRDKSKKDYQYFLNVLVGEFGNELYNEVTSKQAKHAYEEWVKRGITFANHVCTVSSLVYRYAMEMEYVTVNPFANIKRKSPKQRKVVWTEDDIQKFLSFCYGDFAYRNIGLIVHMAYEWCQRLGDMRLLKWESIQFDKQTVHIEQSKRRAEVFLPISDELCAMLREQHDDFGFQSYVAPRPQPIDGVYKPYSVYKLPKYARQLMDAAGLPKSLRLSDLRRTGTTEMVDAGVSIGQIMSVTGHANPQSVKPYMKHTYDSANYALTMRKNRGK